VDRSIIPTIIVRRMISYFVLLSIKNLFFGLALVALVYAALKRPLANVIDIGHTLDINVLAEGSKPKHIANHCSNSVAIFTRFFVRQAFRCGCSTGNPI